MSLYDQALAAGAPTLGGFTPGQSLTPEQILQLRAQSPHTPVGDMVYHPGWETPSLTDAGETGVSRVGDEFVKKLPGNNIAVWNADGTYRGSTADGKITFQEAAGYVAMLAGGAYAINGAAGAAGAAGASNAGAGATGMDFGWSAESLANAGGGSAWDAAMIDAGAGAVNPALSTATAGGLGDAAAQTIEVVGQKLPSTMLSAEELALGAPAATELGTIPQSEPVDPTNYSNEGRNYPTPNSTQGPGGSPINASQFPSTPINDVNGNPVVPQVNNNGSNPFGTGDLANLFNVLSGLYGLKLAGDAAEKSDPFGPYRKGYADKLLALEANPGLIKSTPGFLSGQDAITRQMAAKGYLGSGNQAGALMRFSGDFYNNEANRLATLAGSNIGPGQTYFNQAQLVGQSLSNIGYGLSPYMQGGPR